MLINNRLIKTKSPATSLDVSKEVNNIFSTTGVAIPNLDGTTYLNIGSDLPFNHRYFSFLAAKVNTTASVISVDIWNGSSWEAAVDVLDVTAVGGKCFAQNGIVQWTLDKNKSWFREDSTENMEADVVMSTLKIYNLYWARLKFSAALITDLTMIYMGHKFSNDSDLGGNYPDLIRTNVMTNFKSGKTSWEDQHILAAEEIIRDLRKNETIFNGNQIFGYEEFNDAAVHKVAQIAYRAFGKDYEDRREQATEDYADALDKVVKTAIDRDADGRLDPEEKLPSYGRITRA